MSKKIILHPRTAEGIIQDTEEVYPKTTIDQVYTEDGTTPFGNNSFQKKLTAGDGISLDSLGNISVNFNSTVLKTLLLNSLYPVGSLFISTNVSEQNECPIKHTLGGTWERIKDRFLLASGDTYAIGSTGGSADAVVVSHSHIATFTGIASTTSTNGAHTHTINKGDAAGTGPYVDEQARNEGQVTTSSAGNHSHTLTPQGTVTIASSGESGVGKNMPPYIAVCVWKRIA